jgi:HPt (histidine-containing phosphotransfer) domain-containing protein
LDGKEGSLNLEAPINIIDSTSENIPEPAESTSKEESDLSPIRLDQLFRRVLDDQELALSLLQKMDSRLDKELAEVRLAVEAGDYEQTRLLAHKLKGSAGNLSAEPLRKALEALELAGAAGDWTNISQKLDVVLVHSMEFHEAVAKLK